MFERRLRLFLLFVFLFGMVLAVRAAQVQVIDRDHWTELAVSSAERVQYLPARRGDLLDVKGRVIATDVTRFNVTINFCAIPNVPDADWLKLEATRRAKLLDAYKSAADADAKALIVAQESQQLRADLERMWDQIAQITGVPRAEIDAKRAAIAADVKAKHDAVWRRKYDDAVTAYENAPTPRWYVRLVAGRPEKPDEDKFRAENLVSDQSAYHAVVTDLSPTAYAQLALLEESLPKWRDTAKRWQSIMDLRPAVRREYPFGDTAAHVIGHVGQVSAEDRESDPNKADERRRYQLVDRIGRDGIERLAEMELRGTRGERRSDRSGLNLALDQADPGKPVKATIDIELQRDIQLAFKNTLFYHPEEIPGSVPKKHYESTLPMNGAAVVIDVKTGEVLSLVSVPTYDVNRFDELYEQLAADELNRPLRNRALLDAVEPGSSVKPIIGMGAITQGLIAANGTVHCDGYGHLDGKRIERPRCWTMSIYKGTHQTLGNPHPTGDLTLTDAIERSCNVYFLTLGNKLGLEDESYWMRKFGLGQITGLGLPESRGLLPMMARVPNDERQSSSWYAAIGQGPISATPIQICNEMATIARDGIWMRPRLLKDIAPPPTTRPSPENPQGELIPDRLDLKINPDALRAVHQGMLNVVNEPSGTARKLERKDVKIAAKTGSATAAQLSRPRRNADGSIARDPATNEVLYERIPYGKMGRPNPEAPWYLRSGWDDKGVDKGTHSWVAGYAPADNPQVAFAVYVEYGGSGGIGAGSVAVKLIQACIDRGYLTTQTPQADQPATPGADVPISTED